MVHRRRWCVFRLRSGEFALVVGGRGGLGSIVGGGAHRGLVGVINVGGDGVHADGVRRMGVGELLG